MSKIKRVITLFSLTLLFLLTGSHVLAAEFCDDQYYINQTLANGSKWDMCWSHSKNQGVIYHHIFYTPENKTRRMVLFEASIAQIHVPYDDNGARFHDVSDFGLGDNGGDNDNLVGLKAAECKNGSLGRFNNKGAVCHQVLANGDAYRKGLKSRSSQRLSVFSMSKVGQYIYAIEWNFHDDGQINPVVNATGALQRFGSSEARSHGWVINSAEKVGLAHMHNFYWRLDFDIDESPKNDLVQEINYEFWQGKRYRQIDSFSKESARSVNPETMRSWLVKDTNTTNRKGHNISYEIRLNEAGQREVGPSFEPFTNNDFYVTRSKTCELFASHNAFINDCAANNLSEYVNNESIVDEDVVIWVGVSFYHMPRSEDSPKMDAHVSGFQLIPRDWHTTSPNLEVPPAISLRLSANDDFVTSASKPILIDALGNDTGNGIEFNTLDNPDNGVASIINNKVQYTPNAGFIGTDVFWYTIRDAAGEVYGTQIHVTVTPHVSNDGVSAGGGGSVSILDLLLMLLAVSLVRFSWLRQHKVIKKVS